MRKVYLLLLACVLTVTGFGQTTATWNVNTASTNWNTASNWTPTTVPNTSAYVAKFDTKPTNNTTLDFDLGNTTLGGIWLTTNQTKTVTLTASTSNGTLTLNGVTINSVPNVIIENDQNKTFTIQSGTKTLGLALGVNNANIVCGSGTVNTTVTISSIISDGGNGYGFITSGGTSSSTVNISNTSNSFSGAITLNGPATVFSGDGCFGAVPGSATPNSIIIDGGRLTTSGSYTINSNRGIALGATAGTSISAAGSGATIVYNGIMADKSGSTGTWAKQGGATFQLGGVSTYSGATALNNGITQLTTGNNRLPTGTVLSLGQASSPNLGTLDLNGFNQQVAGINSTTGTNAGASVNTITTTTGSSTLTIGGSGTYSYGSSSAANSGIISGAISLVISGSGTQTLGGLNTYTGSTTINNGTLQLGVAGSLPSGTTISLGQTSSTNTGTFDMNGFNQTVVGINSTTGTGTGTTSNTITTSTGSATLTINGSGTYSYGTNTTTNTGVISGAVSLVMSGSGTQTLGGALSYTGSTTLNSGTLKYNPASNFSTSGTFTLSSGTLSTSGIAASRSVTFGTLGLTASSNIVLDASNAHTLNFAASNGISWTANKIITITGWQGSYGGNSSGTTGQIFFGSSSSGLTAGQLAEVQFYDGTNTWTSQLLSTGELVPSTSIASLSTNVGSVTGLNYNYGSGPSAAGTFTVSGAGLFPSSGNVTIDATSSPDYEVSTTSSSTGFAATATLAYTSLTLTSGNVWIRLKSGKVIGSYNSETVNISGGGATPISITASGSVSAPTGGYFSAASGNLDALSTWGTDALGTLNHPQNFTDAGQVFHLANGNSGAVGSAPWTLGAGNQLDIDQSGNDLTITAANTISGTVYVGPSRTITMQTTTYPTFATPDPASTINFSGLGTLTTLPQISTLTYGGVTLSGNTALTPTATPTLNFAGNFTLTGTASVNYTSASAYLLLQTSGNGNQTISVASGCTLSLYQFKSSKSADTLTFAANSPMTTADNISTVYTGTSLFVDGANTITCGKNLYMDGTGASNYALTGTIVLNATSGTTKIANNSSSLGVIVANLKNLTMSPSGTTTTLFEPASGTAGTIVINGNLNISSSYTSSGLIDLGTGTTNNTINLLGNFTSSTASSAFATGSSSGTLAFVGSSAQSYTSTSSNTFKNVTVNNAAGLTLNSAMTVSGGTLNVASGTLTVGAPLNISGGATLSMAGGPLVLNSNLTVTNPSFLALSSSNLTISAPTDTLFVNGTLSQTSGHINASNGTVSFGGSTVGNQSVPANTFTGTVKNLIINNTATSSAGITLNGALTIGSTGNVYINNGTFTTGGYLTLASDASGDARIDQITGTGALSADNVTVQKYIPGQRSYRTITNPTASTVTLSQFTSFLDITGSGGSTNGFTVGGGNHPSAYYFHYQYDGTGTNSAWQPFTSANGGGNNDWTTGQAILLFVRGSIGQGLNSYSYGGQAPGNVTLQFVGPLNTGSTSLTATVHYDNPGTNNGDGWSLIGNPLPSQINVGAIGNIGSIDDDIQILDPKRNSFADTVANDGYRLETVSGALTVPICGAFLAHNSSTTTDVVLQFPESCKVTGTPPSHFFKTTNGYDLLEMQVFKDSSEWDDIQLRFINGASNNSTDVKDVKKFLNSTFSLYTISQDSKNLARDARDADSLYDGYVIPMGLSTSYLYTYNLVVSHYDQQPGIDIYLHDKYTNTMTLLQNSTTYPVTVSSDTNSQGNNRLELVINNTNTTGTKNLSQNTGNGVKIYPNPASNEIYVSFTNPLANNTNIEIMNTLGQVVATYNTGSSSATLISLPVGNLSPGMYIVKTVSGGKVISERFIKN